MDHATSRRSAMASAREAITRGERPTYHVSYWTADDGTVSVTVDELPGVTFQTTSRKGVPLVARARIALELDLSEESFDLATTRRRRETAV